MIGGKAGEGIEAPGNMLARLCMHAGLWLHSTQEFYSVIKGYNNISQIRVSERPVLSHRNRYDLILAVDDETVPRYYSQVVPGGGIIYDPTLVSEQTAQSGVVSGGALLYDSALIRESLSRSDINYFPVPLSDIAQEKVGLKLAKNIVGLGAVLALLDYEIGPLLDEIVAAFARKGDDIVQKNIGAAQAGYDYTRGAFGHCFNYQLRKLPDPVRKFYVNGNQAMVFGAIQSGLKFVAEYPMTPSTSVLHTAAKHAQEYDISVNHVEDELSAINMAIGAGYAARAQYGGHLWWWFCFNVRGRGDGWYD